MDFVNRCDDFLLEGAIGFSVASLRDEVEIPAPTSRDSGCCPPSTSSNLNDAPLALPLSSTKFIVNERAAEVGFERVTDFVNTESSCVSCASWTEHLNFTHFVCASNSGSTLVPTICKRSGTRQSKSWSRDEQSSGLTFGGYLRSLRYLNLLFILQSWSFCAKSFSSPFTSLGSKEMTKVCTSPGRIVALAGSNENGIPNSARDSSLSCSISFSSHTTSILPVSGFSTSRVLIAALFGTKTQVISSASMEVFCTYTVFFIIDPL
mmetsp:Transcript_6982/g.26095  ORF Transcript_6982/g.26095 Transcript_6982/m.26095 type:complete len:264 (-) Transcript_6982:3679-4470(-)